MTDLKKPVKRVARGLNVPHGVKPDMVMTMYPGGIIGLRESGRRKEVRLSASTLYSRALLEEVRAKRKARKGRR